MKVLITRQKNFAEKTKDLLMQINIDSVIAPVIEINYLDVKKEIENSINIYDFIILTSQNSLIGLDKNFNINNLKSKKFPLTQFVGSWKTHYLSWKNMKKNLEKIFKKS